MGAPPPANSFALDSAPAILRLLSRGVLTALALVVPNSLGTLALDQKRLDGELSSGLTRSCASSPTGTSGIALDGEVALRIGLNTMANPNTYLVFLWVLGLVAMATPGRLLHSRLPTRELLVPLTVSLLPEVSVSTN